MRGIELNFLPFGDVTQGGMKLQNSQAAESSSFFELLLNFLFSLMNENQETNRDNSSNLIEISYRKEIYPDLEKWENAKDFARNLEEGERDSLFIVIFLLGKEIFNEISSQGKEEEIESFKSLFKRLSFDFPLNENLTKISGLFEEIESLGKDEKLSSEAQRFVKTLFENTVNLLSHFSKTYLEAPYENGDVLGSLYQELNKESLFLADTKSKFNLIEGIEKGEAFRAQKVNSDGVLYQPSFKSLGDKNFLNFVLPKSHQLNPFFQPQGDEQSIEGDFHNRVREVFTEIKKAFDELPSSVKEEIKNFLEKKVSEYGEEIKLKAMSERTIIVGKEREIFLIPKENLKEGYLKIKELNFDAPQKESRDFSNFVQGIDFKDFQMVKAEKVTREIPQTVPKVGVERLPEFIKDIAIEVSPRGEKKAFVQLEPPELGKMEVNLRVHDGEVEIQIKVEKHEAFHHLREELSQLRQHIEELGFRVKEFQVSLGLTTSEGKAFAEEEKRKPFRGRNKDVVLEEVNQEAKESSPYHRGILYRIV